MSKNQLDRNNLQQTLQAIVTEVFTTMLGTTLVPETSAQSIAEEADDHRIFSLIGLTGGWTGSGGLCCSAGSAQTMTSLMLFSEYREVNSEVCDAIGELTNMIVGNFKNTLSDITGALAMSTPNVIHGRNIMVGNGSQDEWMTFPFAGPDFQFVIVLRLTPTHGNNSSANSRSESQQPAVACR